MAVHCRQQLQFEGARSNSNTQAATTALPECRQPRNMEQQSRVEQQQESLDYAWMAHLFPNKDLEKRVKWLDMLQNFCQKNAKPATLRALVKLRDLGEQAWKEIGTSPNPPTPSSIRV